MKFFTSVLLPFLLCAALCTPATYAAENSVNHQLPTVYDDGYGADLPDIPTPPEPERPLPPPPPGPDNATVITARGLGNVTADNAYLLAGEYEVTDMAVASGATLGIISGTTVRVTERFCNDGQINLYGTLDLSECKSISGLEGIYVSGTLILKEETTAETGEAPAETEEIASETEEIAAETEEIASGSTLSGGNLWILAAGAVVIVGGAAAIIAAKRKRKSEE